MLIDLNDSGPINIACAGPEGAPPLLFLHAVGLDLSWWDRQFAAFGKTHQIIALDMPGHGLSPAPKGPPGFAGLAHMTEELLDRLGTGPAHVVGLSIGGMIAQELALRRPDLVRSLCLVSTLCGFADPVREALRQRADIARQDGMARIAQLTTERWFPAAFRARRPDVLDRVTMNLLRQAPGAHAAIWEMIARLDLTARISAITCPVLVLTGDADPNAPPAAAQAIHTAIAGSSMNILPGIGHLPPVEAPEEFNALLADFLASQPGHDARGD